MTSVGQPTETARGYRSLLAFAGCLLLAAFLAGGLALAVGATTASSATISGTVTDVDTGEPIGNATITVVKPDGSVERTTTDTDGQYSLPAGQDGDYEVTAERPEYDTRTKTETVSGSDLTVDFELGTTPRYEFTLAAGDTYAIGFPGPLEAESVDDVFDRTDFQGVVYAYDESTGEWEQVVLGSGASADALDAVVVVVDDQSADVGVTMEFDGTAGVDDGTPPERSLDDGWNFVSPPQSNASEAFTEAEEILDQGHAEPESSQVEGESEFNNATIGEIDVRVNPFKGYFVRTDNGANVKSEAYGGITRTRADGSLALGFGSVNGTVVNESGEPVQNATVRVGDAGESTTDAEGAYHIEAVPAGLTFVHVDADGYGSTERPVAIRVNERTTTSVEILEQPAIRGQVTDDLLSEDDAIENATVVVERQADDGSLETVATAETNTSGNYRVFVPRDDTYNVSVEAADHVDETDRSFEVQQDDVTANFALEPLDGKLAGTLTDAVLTEEDGIAGVDVVVTNGTDETIVQTDGNGTFSVPVQAHDHYDVHFQAPDHGNETATAQPGANETIDLSRELDPENATVSGTVTDAASGEGLGDATVTVSNSTYQWTVTVNGDGTYEREVLPHQEYTVTADADGFVAEEATAAVGAGDGYKNGSQVQDFELVPVGSIEGVIDSVNGTELTDADGEPVNATVHVEDQNSSFTDEAETAPGGGSYAFGDLETDTTYNLTISAPHHVTVESTVHLPADDPDRANESYDLKEGGYLFGDVVDFDAEPVPGASVTVGQASTTETVTTDSNGEFETLVVETRTYDVLVEADGYADRTFERNVAQGGTETRFPLVEDGTISGRLTDADTDEPIPNGTVIAVDSTGEEIVTEDVSDDGNFTLSVPGDEEYDIRANSSDHFESANQTVQVDGGQNVEGIDFALDPRDATIDGTVTDAKLDDDDAIANATVTVEDGDGTLVTGFSTTVETDENGSYTVEVPAHGEYIVSVDTVDHENQGPKSASVGAGDEYAGGGTTVDFALTPLPTDVRGNITDEKLETDDAIVGANVTVFQLTENGYENVARTETDDSGAYLVEGVEPHETYRVNVSAIDHEDPDPVERTAGAGDAYRGGPVVETFPLTPLDGSISGTLNDSQTGDPIPNASVVAFVGNKTIERTTSTDENGSYTVTDVPAHEEYTVSSEHDDYETAAPTQNNQMVKVTVGANESVTDVALELDPKPANVTGTVTDAELEDDPEHVEAIPNVSVTVYESSALETEVASDTTDDDGRYKVVGVPADGSDYVVEFDAPNHETAATETFSPDANGTVARDASLEPLDGTIEGIVTDNETGDPVDAVVWITTEDGERRSQTTGGVTGPGEYSFSDVNASKDWTITTEADGYQTEEVTKFLAANGAIQQNFELKPKDGTISGTVEDAESGDPIEGANVTVEGDDFTETVQTNASGGYAVDVATPADYEVSVQSDDYLPDSANVSVDPGGSEVQHFSLEPSGYVFGKVTDSEGQPIGDVQVTIYLEDDLGNEQVVASATTAGDGTFETDPFQTGDYQIRFEGNGYQTEEENVTVTQGPNEKGTVMREA